MINYYNSDKIICINVFDKFKTSRYEYQREVKIFGLRIQKEGIEPILDSLIPISQLPSKYMLLDGIVYEKPECRIVFQENYFKSYWFNTYEQACEKASQIQKDYPQLKIQF